MYSDTFYLNSKVTCKRTKRNNALTGRENDEYAENNSGKYENHYSKKNRDEINDPKLEYHLSVTFQKRVIKVMFNFSLYYANMSMHATR